VHGTLYGSLGDVLKSKKVISKVDGGSRFMKSALMAQGSGGAGRQRHHGASRSRGRGGARTEGVEVGGGDVRPICSEKVEGGRAPMVERQHVARIVLENRLV